MKFVIGEQLPTQFRKCQQNFDSSEFNLGKKKLTNIFTQTQNQEEKQKVQKLLSQKKEEIMRSKEQQLNENENQIFQKHHQKFFGKMVVYPIKIGPHESNKETEMDRQRKKALKLKQQQEKIAKEIYIPIEEYKQQQDFSSEFFDYLQVMTNPSQQQQHRRAQSLSPQLLKNKSQKLDRLEQESCMKQRRLIPGLSLKENNQLKKTDEKEGNTLVLGQSLFQYADQQTKDGIVMQKAFRKHAKTYNRAENKRFVTVDISRGRIGEMSQQFPPMFQRAKFTKNLYFNTNYQKQYIEQKQYLKPGLRLGPVDFRKNNKVPLLFAQ